MIGDLFDSPWKILIVALAIIVLFGSKKLPSAARSLGQSMRILKKEVQGPARGRAGIAPLGRSGSGAGTRPDHCRRFRRTADPAGADRRAAAADP